MDVKKLETAYEIIKTIEKQQNEKMFTKKAETVIQGIIAKEKKRTQLLDLVDERIANQFTIFKTELVQDIARLNQHTIPINTIGPGTNEPPVSNITPLNPNTQKIDVAKDIGTHVDTVLKKNGSKIEEKPGVLKSEFTWSKIKDTDEITRLKCSNEHSITLTKTPENELLARIDNGANKIVTQQDISDMKRLVEQL